MGVADSPLRDRVLFLVGSARSGTTWLAHALGRHPDIAHNGRESHLFDRGVGSLFDNYELRESWNLFLAAFLERERLVDLVRDLCDGVLLAMRDRTKPGAAIVLDKTPASASDVLLETSRKLECYPDAWYLHLIRDGRGVVRSLMDVPWGGGSAAAGAFIWRRSVEGLRTGLAGARRVREVRYEDLVADPAPTLRGILEWLGLDASEAALAELLAVGHVAFAPSRPDAGIRPERWRQELSSEDLVSIEREAGDLLAELGYPPAAPARVPSAETARALDQVAAAGSDPEVEDRLLRRLLIALRSRDPGALAELTAPGMTLEVRSGGGDLSLTGDEARWALLRLFERIFAHPLERDVWARAVGSPSAAFFEGIREDGRAVNLALLMAFSEGRCTAIGVVADHFDGREAGRLEV